LDVFDFGGQCRGLQPKAGRSSYDTEVLRYIGTCLEVQKVLSVGMARDESDLLRWDGKCLPIEARHLKSVAPLDHLDEPPDINNTIASDHDLTVIGRVLWLAGTITAIKSSSLGCKFTLGYISNCRQPKVCLLQPQEPGYA